MSSELIEKVARAIEAVDAGKAAGTIKIDLRRAYARAAIAVVVDEADVYLRKIRHENTADLLRKALISEDGK